ncbi:hypothetical protein MLD38_029642 [Melastoma candidum]|uniref:Uncharacterized protein n=1 Tax=Melastoma candidum TaxID=119954 RepID=A0ACB9N4K0_9MYRT|nr:hypothetical protein MLD38_029642 [Melastoma candidum]
MTLQDHVMEETEDQKNAVESYVYDMRNKISLTPNFKLWKTGCTMKVEIKGVYVAKLEELTKQGDPIEERYKEHVNRGSVISEFLNSINAVREEAISNDPKYEHIYVSKRQKVLNECVEAEAWLREKQ